MAGALATAMGSIAPPKEWNAAQALEWQQLLASYLGSHPSLPAPGRRPLSCQAEGAVHTLSHSALKAVAAQQPVMLVANTFKGLLESFSVARAPLAVPCSLL